MAAAARLAVVAIVAVAHVLPTVAPDSYYYAGLAESWIDGEWRPGSLDALSFEQYRAYVIPLGLIFKGLGPSVVAAQMLAAAFGVAAVAAVAATLSRTLGRPWGLVGGLVAALVPSQVLWSSVGLRESAIWAVTAAITLGVTLAWRATRLRLFLLGAGLAMLFVLLANLRISSLVVASWALVLSALLSPGRAVRAGRVAGALAIAAAVPGLFGAGPLGWQVVQNHQNLTGERVANSVGAETGFVETRRLTDEDAAGLGAEPGKALDVTPENNAVTPEDDGLTPTLPTVAKDGLTDQLRYLPRGLSVMLLEPFPWTSFEGASVRFAQVEILVWYPLLGLSLVGLYAGVLRRLSALVFPAFVGGGLLVVYALVEGNFGTAYRHRGEIVWIVAMFATVGLHHVWRQRAAGRVTRPAVD